MNKDLLELKSYFLTNTFSRYGRITDVSTFPDSWKVIYNASDKCKAFIDELKTVDILPKFTDYIQKYIADVMFVQVNDDQYLIIKLVYKDGTSFYYGGLNPLLSDLSLFDEINLPLNLRNMYFKFLNGFYDIEFGHIGFYAAKDIDLVSDYDFKFLPENMDVSKYYIFFGAGNGSYVVANKSMTNANIIYDDMFGTTDIDFEKEIDEWIVDSLTNF